VAGSKGKRKAAAAMPPDTGYHVARSSFHYQDRFVARGAILGASDPVVAEVPSMFDPLDVEAGNFIVARRPDGTLRLVGRA
jgi:hypothetical protein